jgi:hypothetical protein
MTVLRETLVTLTRGVAGGQVHWLRAPQKAPTPFVVMSEISGVGHYHNQGKTRHVQRRVQFDVYAGTVDQAQRVMSHLLAALTGARSGALLAIFMGEPVDATTWDGGQVNHIIRLSVDATIHLSQ